jgi:hypothetical protein
METPQSSAHLLSSPKAEAWQLFFEQCRALLTQGKRVYAYLLHHGVQHLPRPEFNQLQAQGLTLLVCSLAAEKAQIPFTDQATFCGLGSLAGLMQNTDTFHSYSSTQDGEAQKGPHHSVLIRARADLEHPDLNTLESLRVAAGLSQLSDLQVELQLENQARSLLEKSSSTLPIFLEAAALMKLFHEAQRTSTLATSSTTSSEQKLTLQIG